MSVPATRRLRGLGGVLGALAIAAAAHATSVPAWVPLALVAAIAWRWSADRLGWPMPAPWLRRTVTVAAPLAVLASFRTLNGLEAGSAFLVVMGAIKLLETRAARDLTVLVFIAWFLLYAALLRDQRLLERDLLVAQRREHEVGRHQARRCSGTRTRGTAHNARGCAR